MFKRLIIPLFVLCIISLIGVCFFHNALDHHCPFCTNNAVDFDFIAENIEEFTARDYDFQLVFVKDQFLIPPIARRFHSDRAPPV